MEYWFEAFWIVFAIVFPLGCVVWFLKELISRLGDPSVVDAREDNREME